MSESASGKASSGNTSCDKDVSECPTCGDEFDTTQGMRTHHTIVHGESIAREKVTCDWCGDTFSIRASRVDGQDRFYCSDDCLSNGRSKQYSGENHPLYIEDKPEVECEICGEMFEVPPSRTDVRRTCSKSCQNKYKSEIYTNEKNPNWGGGEVECVCDSCGDKFNKRPSHVWENNFCSGRCHKDYLAKHQRGENHHAFEGGRSTEYGPNWQEQRRKAIERDNETCQDCGTHREDLDCDIHVHHITPRKHYMEDGVLDHERANALDNLVCLCNPCHQKWEGLYLRPDTRD